MTRKTDAKARVTLPPDFANCLVTLERRGVELVIRKARKAEARRYAFRELMDRVTPENLHAEVGTGRPVGREAL
jgi:antitoxin component of MazEF toxin-antitoxin module